MRNLVRVTLVLGAVLMTTAAAAWADKPDKSPSTPNPGVTFAAGVVCPFALTVEDIVNTSSTTTHIDKQGDVRWQHGSGRIVSRFSGNGKSVELNLSGPGKITEDANGLIHYDGTGPWALLFFPGDSAGDGIPSPTALYTKGHIHFTVDPANGFKLTLVSHAGTVENICDMLS